MPRWDWLVKPGYSVRFVRNVVIKAVLLFLLANLLFVLLDPMPFINRLTLYNMIWPGRERLPYADNPDQAYNLTLESLEAMFAAHVLAADEKLPSEYRVLFLGDTSVWGWLLENDETFDACINGRPLSDGRRIEAYNLGYPITNALKDLIILERALRYEPDAIVWFITLEGMYDYNQLEHPLLAGSRQQVLSLVETYDLSLDTAGFDQSESLLEQTLVGQRRPLADWVRHQVYGFAWSNTGTDHVNPRFFRAPVANLPDSIGVPERDDLTPEVDLEDHLAFDMLSAGVDRARSAGVSVLMVNEPIFISNGLNSDLRYNELYPRWIYDRYRERLSQLAESETWQYLDLWDAVPAANFTDFPLHYDAEWTCRIAERIAESLPLAERAQ